MDKDTVTKAFYLLAGKLKEELPDGPAVTIYLAATSLHACGLRLVNGFLQALPAGPSPGSLVILTGLPPAP
jgi:hypothetical protein